MIIAAIYRDPVRSRHYVVLDTDGNYWITAGTLPGRRYIGDTATLTAVDDATARDLKARWGNYR